MSVKNIGVVGAGQMGNGIAQVAAMRGLQVMMTDISDDALGRGLKTIESSLDRLIKKNAFDAAEKPKVLARIKTAKDLKSHKECDLVIEAVSESIDLKLKIFKELDQVCKKDAILCTNTSSI